MPRTASKPMYDRVVTMLTKEECHEVLSAHKLVLLPPEKVTLAQLKNLMLKYRETVHDTATRLVSKAVKSQFGKKK